MVSWRFASILATKCGKRGLRVSDKELLIPASQTDSSAINAQTRRGRMQMLFLLLACAAPVIASYFAYYVIKPEGGKTN